MPAGVSALTPLANITLGSAAAGVTFSSISGSYRDLRLVINGGVTSGGVARWTFNGDTTSTYVWVSLEGDGATASSTSNGNTYGTFANNTIVWTTTLTTVASLDIMDYSATDKHKTVLSRTARPDNAVSDMTLRWPSTAAITSMNVYAGASTWLAGTSFALYGVAS
jgi:hypothetical protein